MVRLFSVHGRLEKIVPAHVPHSCLVHMLHMFIFFKMNLYDLSNDKKLANWFNATPALQQVLVDVATDLRPHQGPRCPNDQHRHCVLPLSGWTALIVEEDQDSIQSQWLKAKLTIIWIRISQTQPDYTTIYNVFSSGYQSIEVDVSWCLLIDVELGLGATEWPLCSEGGLAARNVPCRELQAPRIAPLSSKWWKHELHGTSCNPLWTVTG